MQKTLQGPHAVMLKQCSRKSTNMTLMEARQYPGLIPGSVAFGATRHDEE
jgi:hypothetical protein